MLSAPIVGAVLEGAEEQKGAEMFWNGRGKKSSEHRCRKTKIPNYCELCAIVLQ